MNRPAISQSSTTADDAATSPQPGARLRILLADGDRALRQLIAFVLRNEGHEVVEATDGSELLEAIAALVIDGARPFR